MITRFQWRQALTWLALCVACATLISILVQIKRTGLELIGDYIQYWSAGRLNLAGQNPYRLDLLAELQNQISGRHDVPLLMWNPPWAQALTMPFALFDYSTSRLLWLLAEFFVLLIAFTLIWEIYRRSPKGCWVAWVVGFLHWSSLEAIQGGQITPFVLFGAVLFVYFQNRQRPWLAGASLWLVVLKPHDLYLFLLAVALWVLENKEWRVLYGFAAAMLAAGIIASLPNGALFSQYLFAVQSYPPEQWITATLGGVLRSRFGAEKVWLQFLPLVPGILWFIVHWWRHHQRWEWTEQIAPLALLSLVTAAYGWRHDQIMTLLAILPAFVWLLVSTDRPLLHKTVLIGLYGLLAWVGVAVHHPQDWFWWLPWAVLIWYLTVKRFFLV